VPVGIIPKLQSLRVLYGLNVCNSYAIVSNNLSCDKLAMHKFLQVIMDEGRSSRY